MSEQDDMMSPHRRWAHFRYSVIGGLLAAPPKVGELAGELRRLSEKPWRHPLNGRDFKIAFSTIEGWYYAAKKENVDPLGRLRSKTRADVGKSRRLSAEAEAMLRQQYAEHPSWSYRLHGDNLAAAFAQNAALGTPPSYPTIRRFMKRSGLRKKRRPKNASEHAAINRFEAREVRSYEVEYPNALWHLDYHNSPLKVLDEGGEWVEPVLAGIYDDHSRLCCHMQWYLEGTAENLVHALMQALLKRGLPREIHQDNGKPMIAAEYEAGLSRLGIVSSHTMTYSPYQNGKCEFSWTKIDGRLMAMLEGQKDLTLKRLNDITQAWVEMEYNRAVSRETGERPIDRFTKGRDVGRPSPSPETLRLTFRREVKRTLRRSDCTIALEGRRFEVPSVYRHIDKLSVRYAAWDLSFVHLFDYRTGEEICRVYPVDKAKNADGKRRTRQEPVEVAPPQLTTELPPLLKKLVDDYEASGLRPAYLPKPCLEMSHDVEQ